MKYFFNEIKFYLPTILVTFVVFFLWDKISFSYKNPHEIYGYYEIYNYSVLNDNVRYFVTIFFPSLTYLFTFIKRYKLDISKLIYLFKLETEKKSREEKIPFLILILILITAIIYAVSLEFNSSPMDLFHEGQVLIGAKNFELKNKLWEGNYIVTSLFVDIFSAKLAWNIFGVQNISSYRVFLSILNLSSFCLVIIFIYKLVNVSQLTKGLSRILIFLIQSLLIFYFFKNGSLGYRDAPLFLFFLLVILSNKKNNSYLVYTLLGFLPLVSILWSLDRGVFLIFAYLIYIYYLIFNKKFEGLITILISFFLSFYILYQIVGDNEFNAFIFNSLNIIKSSELLNGIIHPIPFSSEIDSTRATKSILIILLNMMVLIFFLLSQKNLKLNSFKFILFLLSLEAVIYYKIGLTRSDGGHIKQGSALASLQLISIILFILFIKFEKILDHKRNIKIITLSCMLFFVLFIISNFSSDQIKNIIKIKDRYEKYILNEDYNYLNNHEKILVDRLKFLLKNEDCFQVFTYETAVQYFVNKKTCTKFAHIMNLGTKNNQLLFIEQIKRTNPKYILTGGSYIKIGNMKNDEGNRLTPQKRFPYIDNYINEKYKILEKIKTWNILINKNL